MDRGRVLLYGVVPLAVGGVLVALYFSGVPRLQTLAAPSHQREYGLVENLQNLLLLAIVACAWRAGGREDTRRARLGWRAVALLALGVVLEEIDYGSHYWRSLTGRGGPAVNFNLHNQGDLVDWIKRAFDATLFLVFVVAPFALRRLPERWRAWVPSPYSALTVVAALATSKLAHALEDRGWPNNASLRSNISEFREVGTYWLGLLYLNEIAGRRGPPREET